MSIKKDKYFISLANNLAQNSDGFTGPNPSVGAVVVKNDKVISFGSTDASGRPHAEVNALKNLSNKDKKNSTIYISLEPCAHYGKTPPCVDKIIKSKISRVVYSINDPDYRMSGNSYKKLKKKNINVKHNFSKKISKNIYKSYFYSKNKNKPYVYGKLAISKDYFLKDKKKFYMTNNLSLQTSHIIRSKVNCIITSWKTINDDNPKLNCRVDGLRIFSPQIAILDKNLNVKKKSFIINNAKKVNTYIFYNSDNKEKLKYFASKNVKLIYTPVKKNNLDFNFVLKKLYNHDISRILVEGGKSLINSLLDYKFFNEFYLFISEKKAKNNGILNFKNIKNKLSKAFKNKRINETFLDKDNLIHYY